MIRGAIFDADGTLLDSMPIWSDAGARYLKSEGITAEAGLGDILFPMTLEEGSLYLKERYLSDKSPEEIRSGVLRVIEDFYRNEAELKPGAREYLEYLQSLGVKSAVATTGDRALLEAAFRRLGIIGYFEGIYTCSELKTSKREPEIYFTACGALGSEPSETAVFEDVLYAVKTAKSAGFITVAAEDAASEGDREEIKRTADIYIRDFRDSVLFKI